MSRQDKATTERNARVLRDLVKQPDNKTCADCRKNDARWASWNLGVFVCIRCSGMHRAMGTHISKVKSIDLDIWTPEQMENIQKWGNKRANAYWERHLKAGHVPPDHKIESFIRSKYESRRWAMEGPPPADPSVLDGAGASRTATSPPPAQPGARPQAPPQPRPTPTVTAPTPRQGGAHPLLSRQARSPPTAAPAAAPAPLLNFFDDEPAPAPAPAAKPTAPPAPAPAARPAAQAATTAAKAPAPTAAPTQSNIFDLDFKAPTPPAQKQQTSKNDIMSLFSQAAPQQQQGSFFNQSSQLGSWNGGVTSTQAPAGQATSAPVPTWGGGFGDQAAWGGQQQPQHQQPQQQQQQQQQQGWGQPQQAQQGWGQPQQAQQQQGWGQQNNSASANPWGADPWAQPAPAQAQPAPKKDDRDPFANIWS